MSDGSGHGSAARTGDSAGKPWLTLLEGDAQTVLATLPDESVHCCVTSPPYWGLRDYGVVGQLGVEATPDAHVAAIVAVFQQVRRVLREDGTVWINLGDCYAAQRGGTLMAAETLAGGVGGKGEAPAYRGRPTDTLGGRQDRSSPEFRTGPIAHRNAAAFGLKHKDLVGMPWRIAFALQADGWYLRSDIIWSKPNPMPESVTDRPTKAHEYLFLLSKSGRYHYDAEAIKEPSEMRDDVAWRAKYGGYAAAPASKVHSKAKGDGKPDFITTGERYWPTHRNKRSVWEIATHPYPEAHFATFPPDLIKPCILAGCPEGGVVLDPFLGSGTTAFVANQLGRRSIGIELNPAYLDLARKRCAQTTVWEAV